MTMTIEERDTARAIQTIARKLREPAQIDWEQRRYEISKGILCMAYEAEWEPDYAAKEAVQYADALIKRLKQTESDAE